MSVRLLRAKVTAHTGVPGGSESEYTFTLSYEDADGVVTIDGVRPEWLPFWGDTLKVDPSKLIGKIVPAQLSDPENRIEAFFYIPPMVSDCGTSPGSALTEQERAAAMIQMAVRSQPSITADSTTSSGES